MTDPTADSHDALVDTVARSLSTVDPHEAFDHLGTAVAAVVRGLDLLFHDLQRRALTSVRSGSTVERVSAGDDSGSGGARVVVPLAYRGDEFGVMSAHPADGVPAESARRLLEQLSPVVAMWVSTWFAVSDTPWRARRLRPLSLAAEMQADLLPPAGYRDHRVEVSAAIEPAYDTGGDVFDYAVDESGLVVSVLDAMGHGLAAAHVSALATAAARNARRRGDGIVAMADAVDAAIRARHGDSTFVGAVLAELDLGDGGCRWVTAGHVTPLVLGAQGVRELPLRPSLPLGMRVAEGDGPGALVAQHTVLAPGEALILLSDGVYDNTVVGDGTPLGRRRVHEAIEQHALPLEPGSARRVADHLLGFTGSVLRDDATLVIVHRRP